MKFIEVKTLEDGTLRPAFRVYANGRFVGPANWKRSIERMSLMDPQTKERAADGEGVLRALDGLFANRSQTHARFGDDSAESPGQAPDEQRQLSGPSAGPAASARSRP